jgi:hypothetical protein
LSAFGGDPIAVLIARKSGSAPQTEHRPDLRANLLIRKSSARLGVHGGLAVNPRANPAWRLTRAQTRATVPPRG